MLIPYLTLKDPRAAMALYEKALGATVAMVMDGPGGSVMHCEMHLAGQQFMLSCEWPGMSAAPVAGERAFNQNTHPIRTALPVARTYVTHAPISPKELASGQISINPTSG